MKKIIILVLTIAGLYFFYYVPEEFKRECIEGGHEYNHREKTCTMNVNFEFEKEEWEELVRKLENK